MSTTNDFLKNYLAVTAEPVPPTTEEVATKNKAVYDKIRDIQKKIADLTSEMDKQLKLLEGPELKPVFDIVTTRENCKTVNEYDCAWGGNKYSGTNYNGMFQSVILGGIAIEVGNKLLFRDCTNHTGDDKFYNKMCQVAVKKQKKEMFGWLLNEVTTHPYLVLSYKLDLISQLFKIQDEAAETNNKGLEAGEWLYIPLLKHFKLYPSVYSMIVTRMVAKCQLQTDNPMYDDLPITVFYDIGVEASKQKNNSVLNWTSTMISTRENKNTSK